MYNILTLNKIAKCGLDKLNKEKYSITDDMTADADGIILRSYQMHDMELPKSLKAVARAGAGTNNIPIDKCTEKGIVVFNTPGANANAVKELVLASLILASRNMAEGIGWAAQLSGDDVAKQVEKGKSQFVGHEIQGKTLGVIGLGAIGAMVANSAAQLGMNVIGFDPYLSVDAAWKISNYVHKADKMEEVLSQADFITIHVPYMPATKDYINEEQFSMMKDGTILLNFARGELVNTDALKAALASGRIRKYVVDFPNSDVLGVDGVVAVPHLGASTTESEDNCAKMAADELMHYLEEGNIVNSVNFPTCSLPMNSPGRVCIMHQNKPKILGQLTHIISDMNINISDMLNKSKGELAYTIINTDSDLSEKIVSDLEAVEGVLHIRVIK